MPVVPEKSLAPGYDPNGTTLRWSTCTGTWVHTGEPLTRLNLNATMLLGEVPTRAGRFAPVITTGEVGASNTAGGVAAVMPTVVVPVLPPSSVTVSDAVYDPTV